MGIKTKLRQISRKIFIARIIFSIILILVLTGTGIYFLIWNMSQHHFHEEPKNMLCNFTSEEQAEILNAFGIIIPVNEANAYVYSFSYDQGSDERLVSYMIEIGGVEDYEGFYSANPNRRSFNETTLNFRTDSRYFIVYTDSGNSYKYNNLYSKLCGKAASDNF